MHYLGRYPAIFVVICLYSLFTASTALAQDDELEYVDDADNALASDREYDDGFHGNLGVEASLNMVSNDNVVGQNDGTSILLGGGLDGGLVYVNGDHVLRNTLAYNTSWARTPSLETLIKNDDLVDLESLYNYYFWDWLGPFARVNLQTSAFRTLAITADDRTYEITRPDGTVDTETRSRLPLAENFRPLGLFESIGVALEPLSSERLRTSFRLGFGARQTFANGVLAIREDPGAPEAIDVLELQNSFQAGAEGFAGIEGRFEDQRIDYRFGATALVPFINNDDTDRSALELSRLGLTGNVRVGLFDWMGLTYNLRVLRDPQLIEATQIQNSLLLTFNYTLFDSSGD